MDTGLTAELRAKLAVAAMSREELLTLVLTRYPGIGEVPPGPWEQKNGAGWTDAITAIDLPGIFETDGSVGVGDPKDQSSAAQSTLFPSMISVASSWDPGVSRAVGGAVAAEARAKGFNVLLSGGINIARDPRGGRNFEYLGEDPLLTGILEAGYVNGAQDRHVVATIKHLALNSYETGRTQYDVSIDPVAAMESDLLAFDVALQHSNPGSIMCAYNLVATDYACENKVLLTDILRDQWGYRGWVMSDWGAVHSTVKAANAGLDQESGAEADVAVGLGATSLLQGVQPSPAVAARLAKAVANGSIVSDGFYADPLKAALAAGSVSEARLHEMAERVLYGLFAAGVIDDPVQRKPIDRAAGYRVAEQTAEKGIVLLKNEDALLPIAPNRQSVAIIGIHADKGVMSGGGSPAVLPFGGNAVASDDLNIFQTPIWAPSAPLSEMRKLTSAKVSYSSGADHAAAADAARRADRAVVFVYQRSQEGVDVPNLGLPDNQDALIEAVAAANPHTVVVLQTMGPVKMPWLSRVGAVVEAWYPGSGGGEAIAKVMFGLIEPEGRLPQTFPKYETDLPRPNLPVAPPLNDARPATFPIRYNEGADVGYKWFDRERKPVLFPFGYGLSYTAFRYGKVEQRPGHPFTLRVSISNSGKRPGTETVQAYTDPFDATGRRITKRLIGWNKVRLQPGETRLIDVDLNPQMFGTYRPATRTWQVEKGSHVVRVGSSSADLPLETVVATPEMTIKNGRHAATPPSSD